MNIKINVVLTTERRQYSALLFQVQIFPCQSTIFPDFVGQNGRLWLVRSPVNQTPCEGSIAQRKYCCFVNENITYEARSELLCEPIIKLPIDKEPKN